MTDDERTAADEARDVLGGERAERPGARTARA